MCLIVFAVDQFPKTPLILVANRDEFYERPTEPLQRWKEADCFAGRDLQAGGTWMGVRTDGGWAAVTNFRGPNKSEFATPANPLTRGNLVKDYLSSKSGAQEYLMTVEKALQRYRGFNLLVGDRDGTFWILSLIHI